MENKLDLQLFYPENLQIQDVEVTEDCVFVYAKSRTREFTCPKCQKKLDYYHAVHTRKVQDLPVMGKRTMLIAKLYEFNCDNEECECTSVTENYDGFLNNYSRMTERLADLVTELALETSCEGAARILNSMQVKISGDTIIHLLLKRYRAQPAPVCGSSIGVDDFSFKRGKSYGTIIIDEGTHTPVALLDGREGNELKAWLEQNKHVTTVTRDRASAYARAIEEVLPDAMQIADRFHLHQNLLEAVKKILNSRLPSSVEITGGAEESASGQVDGKKNR